MIDVINDMCEAEMMTPVNPWWPIHPYWARRFKLIPFWLMGYVPLGLTERIPKPWGPWTPGEPCPDGPGEEIGREQ